MLVHRPRRVKTLRTLRVGKLELSDGERCAYTAIVGPKRWAMTMAPLYARPKACHP